ncbi:myb protein X [Trifolium repens]|nr:myb protein X [Trifolium repens]
MNTIYGSDFSLENHQIESQTEPSEEEFYECFDDTNVEYENFDEISDTSSHESDQIEFSCSQEKGEKVVKLCSENFDHSGNFDLEGEEKSKLVFKFQYQNWNCNLSEELKENLSESSDFDKRGVVSSSANKYEFISGKSLSQFLDKPEPANFTVKEFFIHSNDNFQLEKNNVTNDDSAGLISESNFKQENCEEVVDEKIVDNLSENLHIEEVSEKLKNSELYTRNFLLDDDFICSSSDTDSISSLDDGFLSDTDFGTTTEHDTLGNNEENVEDLDFMDDKTLESLDFGYEPDDFAGEDEDIMNELGKLEEEIKNEQSVKQNSKSLTAFDLEESNRFDTLWEHQDLLEQLKMELKMVRATGLPTIFEDSESPRVVEDLKPWKIDEKFQHSSSTTNELPKFYRSYRERMRKFDILNYQKMYALGVMKSKDPLKSFSIHKKTPSSITCILPRGINFLRRKNIDDADPMEKFIRELYSDLEMVYVGHLCLSWEFLRWEYEKALKIWESDQYGFRRFNEVAGEFQQFQVLLQRFIENEPFQGPRVENYARNRCAMRNLLQVPVIKEDKGKDRKKYRKREIDNDAITSDMLVEILEESIRTIWRFIRGDKDASNLKIKCLKEHHVELKDPADSQLLVEIQMDLQKKEKKLIDILKSESCILKKFQKHNEDGTDPVLYFFSQVDMKLVWRVLNMSRITTDQLAWCRSKLNKINFVNRRIHVEPSFLLFPS